MRRTARLGTTTELDGFGLVAVVARSDDDQFSISAWTPDEVAGMALPRLYASEWAKRQTLTEVIGSLALLRSFGPTNVALVSGGSTPTNSLDEWRRMAAAAVRG